MQTKATEHEGTALEIEIWLSLKEASAEAPCCTATIKRAIKRRDLVGRKVGTGHNASYEISRSSFDEWLALKRIPQPKAQVLAEPAPTPTPAPAALPASSTEEAGAVPESVPAAAPTEPGKRPQMTKAERRRLKAARKKEIPESARRLRRWKNYMRHASQEQALAMIKWLSARLAPKKSLSKMILKEALKQDKLKNSTSS